MIHDIGGADFKDSSPASQKCLEKIRKEMDKSIAIIKTNKGNMLFSTNMTVADAIKRNTKNNKTMSIKEKLREVAFILRRTIMDAETTPLLEKITITDIANGEIDIPEILEEFMTNVICGPDYKRQINTKERQIKAISKDILFPENASRKRPKKHLQLGLAVKSLTGNRQIIELLNRMGHSINYHAVTEIETEMTFEARNRCQYTPYGMELVETVGTRVAWDNYDRFVETSSGKDTLHDTVGINYQVLDFSSKENPDHVETTAVTSKTKNRKRHEFESAGPNIQPYREKPKVNDAVFLPEVDYRKILTDEVAARKKNALFKHVQWMVDVFPNDDKTTPMWVGWIAIRDNKQVIQQKI